MGGDVTTYMYTQRHAEASVRPVADRVPVSTFPDPSFLHFLGQAPSEGTRTTTSTYTRQCLSRALLEAPWPVILVPHTSHDPS